MSIPVGLRLGCNCRDGVLLRKLTTQPAPPHHHWNNAWEFPGPKLYFACPSEQTYRPCGTAQRVAVHKPGAALFEATATLAKAAVAAVTAATTVDPMNWPRADEKRL
jgi:hypothetical protein